MTKEHTYTKEEVVKIVEDILTIFPDTSSKDLWKYFTLDALSSRSIIESALRDILKEDSHNDELKKAIITVWQHPELDSVTKKAFALFLLGGLVGYALTSSEDKGNDKSPLKPSNNPTFDAILSRLKRGDKN